MAHAMRTLFAATTALVFVTISASYATRYSSYISHGQVQTGTQYAGSAETPYTYEFDFHQEELGVLNRSYWVAKPQLFSGAHYVENGMLKIESDNCYQVGFGMDWKSPTYEKGDWEPWLPLYWKYHCEATFEKPEVQWLVVENWIAWENGKSITAMVWYQDGSLKYSYGGFPDDGGTAVTLGQFTLSNVFNVTIDADYKTESLTIDWSNHKYSVPLQIERIGTIPKPFTHFQITLMEPGTIYVKDLKVTLS